MITQTIRQMTAITLARSSPNSSIFFVKGDASSSSDALLTADWIWPISVRIPVPTTTPKQEPLEIVVEAKSMFVLAWISQSLVEAASASASLDTDSDSPVS